MVGTSARELGGGAYPERVRSHDDFRGWPEVVHVRSLFDCCSEAHQLTPFIHSGYNLAVTEMSESRMLPLSYACADDRRRNCSRASHPLLRAHALGEGDRLEAGRDCHSDRPRFYRAQARASRQRYRPANVIEKLCAVPLEPRLISFSVLVSSSFPSMGAIAAHGCVVPRSSSCASLGMP